ncbi:MAG: tetratricopeptide repeat protein [Kofleriaceae bacterium]
MIEATCSACGTHNRIAETDVPVGAKFVACSSCKSRVALPNATKQAVPTIPKLPTAVPAIPSIKGGVPKVPAAKPPAIPVGPPSIPLGPAGASAIPVPTSASDPNEIIDLSDLPAPKRQSPLGGAPESKPAPRSGLAAALEADLPAPKVARPAGPPPASLDLDDLLGPPGAGSAPEHVDLPAPKAKASADLPAPKVARPAPIPAAAPGGESDLPAPKPRSPISKAAPQGPAPISLDLDLPAPVGHEISDLPAPKGVSDLPAPKQSRGTDLPDLLQPKPRAHDGLPDLLQPKPGQVPGSGSIDLPAPKGGGIDLPAPKGFFDDLPQPAKGQRSGAASSNEIAPKGFFDDLPQPAKGQRSGPAPTDDIAPKGFFDDLPQPAKGQKSGPTPTDDIAPKGFFDDLPQPATISPPAPVEQPRLKRDSRGAIDLGDDPIEQIDLANEAPQELELEEPALPSQSPSGSFDDLDLSAPSAALGARAQALEDSPIKIGTPKTPPGGKAPERASLPSLSSSNAGLDQPLELEEPRETQSISQRLAPKQQRPTAEAKPIKKPVNRKLVLGLVLGLAAAGGGGFYFYQRHAAQQERLNTIEEELAKARKALSSDNANRWNTATMAATKVLEIEPTNGAAAGIFAEASFAGALADGKNIDARFANARKKINDALGAGVTGPELDRASALSTLTTNPKGAITKLKALQTKSPKDPSLALYMAWAQAAAGNAVEAIKAYDAAAAAPATKLHALLGRGRVKLEQADLEGARADFTAALEVDKKNIAAQVGLAAALPPGQTQQQEADLLGIIAAKEFKDADPRAKAVAYVLAGDAARRTNRLDVARERYRKALDIDKKAIGATVSLAQVELADGKLDAAKTLIDQALGQVKDHAPALLAKATLALAEKRIDDADAIIKALEERSPPLSPLMLSRVGVARGQILEAKGQDDEAVEAYTAAAKLAGELDLTPTMAAISKLTDMAKAAAAAKDVTREATLKARAEELLATLASAAEKDPSLAFTLGVAYQRAGQPALAEPWLQKVIAARPNDPDAMYQLAVVLRSLDRGTDALAMLEKARAAAPDRIDLAMELARTYEAIGKDTEAGDLYSKLLADPAIVPPIELRMYAGLYYVRSKKLKEAGEQGAAILKVERDNATGHYLVGESHLANGNLEDARREFIDAVAIERTARHLDALGRANESLAIGKKDMAMQDAAIRAYQDAIKLDPTLFSSQLGLGRLYVVRKEMEKAVIPLLEANKLKANDPEVSFNLGAAYIRIAKNDKEKKVALQWLLQAAKLDQSAETYSLLGDIYSMEGIDDGRAAANAYGKAVHAANQDAKKNNTPLPPWYAEALFQWGRRSMDVGDNATAKKAWEQWLGMSPPPPMNARRKEVERMIATTLRGP